MYRDHTDPNYRQRRAPGSRRCLFLLLLMAVDIPAARASFMPVQDIDAVRIRQVETAPHDPSFMAVASDSSLYISKDQGTTFRKHQVFVNEEINHLFIDEGEHPVIYLAASKYGYRIGDTTERIFTSREHEVLFMIMRHGEKLYAGSSAGFYSSDLHPVNWIPEPGLRNCAIRFMEPAGRHLYLVGDRGVDRYGPDGRIERLFMTSSTDAHDGLAPYLLRVDAMNPSRLWLCTSKGIYSSPDRGETWQKRYISGIGNSAAYCLEQFSLDASSYYLCSNSGFFKVDIASNLATALYAGLSTSKATWVDLTDAGDIYLATDQGLFRQPRTPAPAPRGPTDWETMMEGEPDIHEVQEAAMHYNSVHPDKTRKWRKEIKYRALMPRLSVDYDKTIGSSFTSSGHYYAQGPYDWGVTLTWDMGNLIWNSYEDNIDNRTKLTTQLRIDILDEINRLYFERLGLKHEIIQGRANREDTTLKELRLYELTASLDGYTGGLYSTAQP